jgi:regulatory protein
MDEPPSLPVITAIRSAGRTRHRLLVLDDGREFVFSEEACERTGAGEGRAATEELFAALDAAEQRVNAHEAALRLLSHRSRSENEMRTRLALRGIDPAAIEDEIARLLSAGLLDDAKFARAWVEDRKRMAPRGRRMLRYELLGRGIEPESVDLVTRDIDDASTALSLARAKARGSPLADYETFLAKVGGFLRRRGFDYAVATDAARSAWAELAGAAAPEAGEGVLELE